MELHGGRVLNGLGRLMKMIVGTSPVQDPHTEQAEEDQIVDTSPINSSKPFCPLDHIGPKLVVEEQVWEDVPPPPVVNDGLVVWFVLFDDSMEGILGYL